jgi:hypothetical protein
MGRTPLGPNTAFQEALLIFTGEIFYSYLSIIWDMALGDMAGTVDTILKEITANVEPHTHACVV